MPLVRRIIPVGGLRAGLNTSGAPIPERRIVVEGALVDAIALAVDTVTARYVGVTIETVPDGIPGTVQTDGKTTIEAGTALARNVEVGADAQGRAVALPAAQSAFAIGRTVTSCLNAGDLVEVEITKRQVVLLPRFVAITTLAGAASGNVSRSWPAGHAALDIGLLFVETANQPVATPVGWNAIANGSQGDGVAGSTTASCLQVFWARAASGAEAAASIAVAGDHAIASMAIFRNCLAAGNPINASAGNTTGGVSTTAVTIPGATTSSPNCLVVGAASRQHSATGGIVTFDASALQGFAERQDAGSTVGNGGGFASATGLLVAGGAYADITGLITVLGASLQGRVSLALSPLP